MYSLRLPPDVVSRLYRLREEHSRGPIRRQVLAAVEGYLSEAEATAGLQSNGGAMELPDPEGLSNPPPSANAVAPR